MRLNEYRIMWTLVFFDLPTETDSDKRSYVKFRNNLLKDGFQMFQFSIYMRHSFSKEIADVHTKRVKSFLPSKGKVGILSVTDKQFGMMEIFDGKEKEEVKPPPQQLEFF